MHVCLYLLLPYVKKNISDPYIDASANQLEVSHKDPFLGHFYSQNNKNDFNF